MQTATDLTAQVSALRATVAQHNAAIRRHRKDRQDAQEALRRLEDQLQQYGIRFVIEPQHSKGAVHGTPKTHT